MDSIKSEYDILKPIAQGKNGKIFTHKSEDKILKIVFLVDDEITNNKCKIQIGESFKDLIKQVRLKKTEILSGGNNDDIIEVYSIPSIIKNYQKFYQKIYNYHDQLNILKLK